MERLNSPHPQQHCFHGSSGDRFTLDTVCAAGETRQVSRESVLLRSRDLIVCPLNLALGTENTTELQIFNKDSDCLTGSATHCRCHVLVTNQPCYC